jgi:hypothetical protein
MHNRPAELAKIRLQPYGKKTGNAPMVARIGRGLENCAQFLEDAALTPSHTCRSQYPSGVAQLGGNRSFADTRRGDRVAPPKQPLLVASALFGRAKRLLLRRRSLDRLKRPVRSSVIEVGLL